MERVKTMKRKLLCGGMGMLALLLCVATLFSSALPAEAADTSLEYGIYGRENNVSYEGEALYRFLLESEPTPAEARYIDKMGISFSYNSAIPSSCVSTEYDSSQGILHLIVSPYRYTAANGALVVWLPSRATVDGEEVALTQDGEVYRGQVNDIFYSEDFDMTVDYAWSVTIPRETVARLRTEAYAVGEAALAKVGEYEKKLEEYNKKVDAYNAWQDYLIEKAAYEAYLEALELYLKKVDAYNVYLDEKADYLVKKDAYDQWQKYYNVDLPAYKEAQKKRGEYETFLTTMEAVKKKLALMDYLYQVDGRGWALRASVMGPATTLVLDNKEELVDVLLCSEEDVDMAGAATKALRTLYEGYDSKHWGADVTTYSGIADRYGYFTDHYDEFKVNFTNLYKSLKALFDNEAVERMLESKGKREHYMQLIGQLYVVSTCFDQEGTRKSSWRISGKKLEEVLEPVHIIDDGDWDPQNTKLPKEVPFAPVPTEVASPDVENPSQMPIEPDPVEHPGKEPEKVVNPDLGGVPEKCETYPTNSPTPPKFDSMTDSILQEIQSGILKKYTGSIEAITLDFSSTLEKQVSVSNKKTVVFRDIDGTPLHTESVDYGGGVFFEVPEHAPSPAYNYRTLGWIGASGEAVDLNCVTKDMDVYPHYEMIRKNYTVTFQLTNADGEVRAESCAWPYGSLPEPSFEVSNAYPETYAYRYEFSGWDREIELVTEDAVYRGSIQRIPKEFPIRWVVGERVTTELWQYGTLPVFTGDTTLTSVSEECTFLGFTPKIEPVKGSATYTATYERIPYAAGGSGVSLKILEDSGALTVMAGEYKSVALSGAILRAKEAGKGLNVEWENGCKLSVSAKTVPTLQLVGCEKIVLQSFLENGDAVYELSFYGSGLREVSLGKESVLLYLPYREYEDGKMTAFFLVDGKETETRILQKSVALSQKTVIKERFAYPMNVEHNPLCNTMALGWDALIGERVSLKTECEYGYEIADVKVTDAEGNEIEVKDLSFVMPECPVNVVFDIQPIVYRVIFRSEGNVISDRTYGFGEKPEIPDAPTKESDGEFIYNFLNWGAEIPAMLTGEERELIFEAQFSREKEDIDYETGNNNNLLFEVVLPVALAVIVVLGTGITVLCILRKRKKKHKIKE